MILSDHGIAADLSVDAHAKENEPLRSDQPLCDERNEEVEAVASELALIDGYDPNLLSPSSWAAIRDDYREKAERVLAALERSRP
jgi:hypothetical protein